jgi:hypothetical protein
MEKINGYEQYLIDRDGIVYNTKTNKFITTRLNKAGYETIMLLGKSFLLHRLIAKTFIPNPNNLPVIDHIDRNRQNNSLENLRWVSQKENSLNKTFDKKNSKSGVRWVNWYKPYNKWVVRVHANNTKNKHIGYANTIEEAVKIRNEYCQLNNIEIIE